MLAEVKQTIAETAAASGEAIVTNDDPTFADEVQSMGKLNPSFIKLDTQGCAVGIRELFSSCCSHELLRTCGSDEFPLRPWIRN